MASLADRALQFFVAAINPDEEDQIIRRTTQRRAAVGDPALAKRVGQMHREHRYMRGGHKYALAQIGTTSSPMVAAGIAAAQRIAARDRWVKPGDVVKGGVRSILTVLDAPLRELQAQAQAIYGAAAETRIRGGSLSEFAARGRQRSIQQFGTSPGGIALGKLLQGERVDLGTGFMPGGDVVKEHLESAVLYPEQFGEATGGKGAALEGLPITAGRMAAFSVTEPGTRAFNTLSGLIDAFTAFTADPAAPALKAGGKAIQSRKLIDEAGGVRGIRLGVLSKSADQWLTGKGKVVVDRLADMTSFDEIWRATGKKLPVDLVRQIADAPDRNVVEALLRPELGVTIREQPQLLRRPANELSKLIVRKPIDSVRLLRNMPHAAIDVTNLDDAVLQVDRLAAHVKMPAAKTAMFTDRMARTDGNLGAALKVVTDMMSDVDGVLVKAGWSLEDAKKYTTMYEGSHEKLRAYFIDEIGRNVPVVGATVDPVSGLASATPHLAAEYLNRVIPLPDLRELRSATSKYRNILTNPAIEIPEALYGALIEKMWKPMLLLRGAWPVRVLSELQVRMAGVGLESAVAHPISYLAWAFKRQGIIDELGAVTPVGIQEDFLKALPAGSQGFRDAETIGKVRTGNMTLYQKHERGFDSAWADEIRIIHSDPVGREVAKLYNDPQAARDWFNHGPGQKFRLEMAKAPGKANLNTIAGANKQIDDTLRRIAIKTGGDPELIQAITTGKLRGAPLRDTNWNLGGFERELKDLHDVAPAVVRGDQMIALKHQGKAGEYWNRGLERAFHALMAAPESKLARSPAWKQFYWKDMTRLMPNMTPEAQQAALSVARSQKIPAHIIKKMESRARVSAGNVTISEATDVAKGFALQDSLKLLYNFHEKSQFADAFRFVFPFGEAFKEVTTSWFRITTQNPQVIRRGQQVIQGARDSGWFQHDESTDQEMFTYPGSSWLTERTLGVPMPLRAPVKGLNIIGSIIPGVGPAVQIPVSYFMPDTPSWQKVREVILPYGAVDDAPGILESQLPGYAKRLLVAWREDKPSSVRALAEASGDIMKYLATTGEYDTQDPEDVDRMVNDAKKKARTLFVVRGLAQFIAPSAPRPQAVTQDKTGKLLVVDMLAREYRKNADENGHDQAVAMFLDKYGDEARFVLQGKTHEVTAGVPVDKEGLAWIKAHPEIVEKYANTYGMFAPHGEDFSPEARERAIRKGDLQILTPAAQARRANNRVAQMIYRNARTKTKDLDYLRRLREQLIQDYPGFQDETGLTQGASTATILRELQEAANDPMLAETQAGEALTIYLSARERALEAARKKKLQSFATSDKMKSTRAWLRDLADALVEEYPDFRTMWERGLSREGKMGAEE